jgi:hypothetical protein
MKLDELSSIAQQSIREAGINLHGLSTGELQVVDIAAQDGQLIADPSGGTFLDKLSLNAGENKKTLHPDDDHDADGIRNEDDTDHPSFVERLKWQRIHAKNTAITKLPAA